MSSSAAISSDVSVSLASTQRSPVEESDSPPATARAASPTGSVSVRHSVQLLNVKAMELIRLRDFDGALEKLQQAEALLNSQQHKQGRDYTVLRATTLSNLGLLHRSVNQIRPAHYYTNRALRLEINYSGSGGAINPAATHLNMCAILSQMGRHKSALLHAECALASLYLEMQRLNEAIRGQESQDAETDDATYQSNVGARDSLMSLIAIAYHNQAVEQEYLRQFRAAEHSFARATQFSEKRLGKKNHLTLWCAHAYQNALKLHPLKFQRSFAEREKELDNDESDHGSVTPRHHDEKDSWQPLPPNVSYIRPPDALKYRTQKHRQMPLNPFEVVQAIQPKPPRKPKPQPDQSNASSPQAALPPIPIHNAHAHPDSSLFFPPSSLQSRHPPSYPGHPSHSTTQPFPALSILQTPNDVFYTSSPRFAYRSQSSGGSGPLHGQPRFHLRPAPAPMSVSMGAPLGSPYPSSHPHAHANPPAHSYARGQPNHYQYHTSGAF